jgi:uncharacterized protein
VRRRPIVAALTVEAGPFIQTVSGRRINPFEPEPELIEIGDIAQALSNQCRFGGHCRSFYSVAQHSCLLSDLLAAREAEPVALLSALLHDAPEAYLVDLPHPLKHRSELGAIYRETESRLHEAVCGRFALPLEPPPGLKELERGLLAAERRALMTVAWSWPELEGAAPLDVAIEPWTPPDAKREFLARFERLDAAR